MRVLRADSGVADYVVGWLVLLPYAGLGCLLLVCGVVASVVGNLGVGADSGVFGFVGLVCW